MATQSAVSTSLDVQERNKSGEEQSPTTPRPRLAEHAAKPTESNDAAPSTPTSHDVGSTLGPRSLLDEPSTPAPQQDRTKEGEGSLKRNSTHMSNISNEDDDVDMDEFDDEHGIEEDASDNESVTSDSQRPSKKKKGQRFFCTDFPPCHLSFTRSEHLARHIRKHTGERPFQCHCSRRFSRLDNLRQHAQTVHVNEEIPGDSLAATSTRFQRQIRTDRVRPPNKSRATTMGSQGGGHSRGHSRNLSSSSVGSTASSLGYPEEARRRPQPLAIAQDPSARAKPTIDTYSNLSGSPQQQSYPYYVQGPPSTPPSTTFSGGPSSPHFGLELTSPSSLSRSTHYNGARHGPDRRMSVPSAANPYATAPLGATYPPAYFSPIPSGTSATFSQGGSMFGSPTSSVFSHGRRESESELEYRRRTWHPGTSSGYSQRPATSGLLYHQTPDDQRPAASGQPAASQVTRLPGIESFDHAPPSNARQQPSPMLVDARPLSSHRGSDAGLHQGIRGLDITAANAPGEAQWQAVHPAAAAPPGYFPLQPSTTVAPQYIHHSHSTSMPEPITPRRHKRQGWYGGPVQAQQPIYMSHRPSPEDSGSSDGVPTPSTSQGTEFHPVIINAHGVPEAYPPGAMVTEDQKVLHSHQKSGPARADSGFQSYVQAPTYALQAGHDPRYPPNYQQAQNPDMGRLEALVAVATSEGRATENRS
ncbi:hypothetical protein B0A50_07435 [Salinomyces thailandicus]|uniref:C2H2-type domain-containing protein n=1 Tax=Salinomyces thailandicus TaxID=706561 RepID=A0A4U0TNK7_9PEZI|nr:hypothetical protein B0A50_07435 [Salinomyces thailandica]